MFPPQTYKIVKCLSEFSKTGLNKRIPREGTRTNNLLALSSSKVSLNKRIPREGTRTVEGSVIYFLTVN